MDTRDLVGSALSTLCGVLWYSPALQWHCQTRMFSKVYQRMAQKAKVEEHRLHREGILQVGMTALACPTCSR